MCQYTLVSHNVHLSQLFDLCSATERARHFGVGNAVVERGLYIKKFVHLMQPVYCCRCCSCVVVYMYTPERENSSGELAWQHPRTFWEFSEKTRHESRHTRDVTRSCWCEFYVCILNRRPAICDLVFPESGLAARAVILERSQGHRSVVVRESTDSININTDLVSHDMNSDFFCLVLRCRSAPW